MPPYQFQGQNFYQRGQQFNPYGQPAPEHFEVAMVSSVDEARNAIVNPLSTHLFLNPSTGEIYFKRMNSTGLSDFVVYAPIEDGRKRKNEDPLMEINARLAAIEMALGGNSESVAGNESAVAHAECHGAENGGDAQGESPAFPKGSANDKWKKR